MKTQSEKNTENLASAARYSLAAVSAYARGDKAAGYALRQRAQYASFLVRPTTRAAWMIEAATNSGKACAYSGSVGGSVGAWLRDLYHGRAAIAARNAA